MIKNKAITYSCSALEHIVTIFNLHLVHFSEMPNVRIVNVLEVKVERLGATLIFCAALWTI